MGFKAFYSVSATIEVAHMIRKNQFATTTAHHFRSLRNSQHKCVNEQGRSEPDKNFVTEPFCTDGYFTETVGHYENEETIGDYVKRQGQA